MKGTLNSVSRKSLSDNNLLILHNEVRFWSLVMKDVHQRAIPP